MLSMMLRIESTPRKASATEILLLAESSRVRSNHWVPAVMAGLSTSTMTYLASEVMRSLLIGLRLYGMAEEPIWFFSNGSSISLKFCSRRMSLENLLADWAMALRSERT